MKPIPLISKHRKSLLLEMCKKLFPEWKAHSLITGDQYVSDDTNTFSESDETFEIHWFEFTWILLNKICQVGKYTPIQIANTIANYGAVCFYINKEILHPIDYLYQLFKELKL